MMNDEKIMVLLTKVLNGDLNGFLDLLRLQARGINRVAACLSGRVLKSEALVLVLLGLKERKFEPALVQRWASLMRWGFIGALMLQELPRSLK